MSQWTIKTLKEHYDALLTQRDMAVAAAFEAAKEKSQSHNDLIADAKRKEETFVTKTELRAGLAMVTAIITAIAAIIGVVVYFVR